MPAGGPSPRKADHPRMRNGDGPVCSKCPSCGMWQDARQMVPQLRATGSGFEIEVWFWCKACWQSYVKADGGCSLSRDKLLRGLHRWSEMLTSASQGGIVTLFSSPKPIARRSLTRHPSWE